MSAFSAWRGQAAKSHPRTGVIFLAVKGGQHRVRRVRCFCVVERTRIEGNRPTEELGRKGRPASASFLTAMA